MNYKVKKKWLIIWGLIILFIIGNPSIRKFKSYLYNSGTDIRREYNFFLFSIYTEKNSPYNKTYYLGILFNFINLGTKDTY